MLMMLFILAISAVYAIHVSESIWQGVGKLSTPAVIVNVDTIAVGSEEGVVALLSALDGTVIWRRKLSTGPVTGLQVTQDGLVAAETVSSKTFFSIARGVPVSTSNSPVVAGQSMARITQGRDWVMEARASDNTLLWRRDEALTCLSTAVAINSAADALGDMHVSEAESTTEHILVGYSDKAELLLGFSITKGFTRWRMSLPTGEKIKSLSVRGGKIQAQTETGAVLLIDPKTGASTTTSDNQSEYTVKLDGPSRLVGFKGLDNTWTVQLPISEHSAFVTHHSQQQETVPVTVRGTDATVLFKYLNPSLVALTSQSDQGIHFRLVDSVSGRIVWAGIATGASGPVHVLVCDNWMIAHFFANNRWELLVVELFEPRKDPGVLQVLKQSLLGKAESSSVFDLPAVPWAISKRFIFNAGGITTLGVTTTARGVSPRTVVFALVSQQILALNKDSVLSARRPSKVRDILEGTDDDGLLAYHPEIGINFPSIASHTHLLPDIRAVVSAPTPLESTSLAVSLGLDVYAVPIRCPSLYDALDPSFDFQMLATSLAVVGVAVFISQVFARRKENADRWK